MTVNDLRELFLKVEGESEIYIEYEDQGEELIQRVNAIKYDILENIVVLSED